MLLALWCWAACAPWLARIESAPVGAGDGDVFTHDGPIHLALVGYASRAPDALFRALADRPAQLVLLTGSAVSRSRPKHWRQLHQRVDKLKVLPVAGRGERAGDPEARGLMAAWDGLGVSALTDPGPWYAVDLHTNGARWRVVVLDTAKEQLGTKWNDQRYWVPKVVGDDSYDHAIIVFTNGPGRMDGSAGIGTLPAEELLELIRSHADATRLAMVVNGDSDAPAVILPGGRWGEAWVTTGPTSKATHALQRLTATQSLSQDYVEALTTALARRSGLPATSIEEMPAFEPGSTPVAGYWDLTLDGSTAQLVFHLASSTGWSEVRTLNWSPMGGWRKPPE